MSLLNVQNLHVRYPLMGPLKATLTGTANRFLDAVIDVSFEAQPGTTLAIAGESGSGKSTLARAIIGLTPIASGTVVFDGAEPLAQGGAGNRAYHREVAMMFQDPVSSLSPRRTVAALISEPFIIHGLRGKDLNAEARRLLALVGLPADFSGRYPHQLSGGQARRVGVARAIALNPKLILADEPTAGLDVSVQGEILNLLTRLQGEFGLTYILITHNLAVVRHIADRVAIMYMGRFVETGPTAAVFSHSAHPYSAGLIADQPHPDPAKRRTRPALTGEVTSLKNRPQGCAFHPRCSYAKQECQRNLPPETAAGAQRLVRCFYPLNRPGA